MNEASGHHWGIYKPSSMKLPLVVISTALFSCHSSSETKPEQANLKSDEKTFRHNPSNIVVPNNATFLDSVSKKTELSIQQIKQHTNIDSVYFTERFSEAAFTGDTVFNFENGLKGVIVKYDDRTNCIYEFLLIFPSGKEMCTDNKIIYTDCDRDESADYTMLRYKLLNGSIFETITTYIPAKTKIKKIEKTRWKVSSSGMIDTLR